MVPDAEEEKPDEPDLDALLEQFREPAEELRRKRGPVSIWFVLALILSVAAVWLAFRVQPESSREEHAVGLMKAGKVGERVIREEEAGTVDVAADYLARCQKGMTAREVRWIVEDFQKAGLDKGSMDRLWDTFTRPRDKADPGRVSDEAATRKALETSRQQRIWYLGLLADALRLSKPQRQQAKERCEIWFATAEATFSKAREETIEARKAPSYHVLGEIAPYTALLGASGWLEVDALAPWALCDLTDDQLAITHHADVIQERDNPELSSDEEAPDPGSWLERRPSGSTAAVTRQQIEEMLAERRIEEAGSIFPFGQGQRFGESGGDLLEEARKLHPAQLKTLLLLVPQVADDLLRLLDQAGE